MGRARMWELLLVHNLVRLEMERTAEEAEVEAVRISSVALGTHATSGSAAR
jgi:hypothetical protein